jgi:hypothetical protein
LKIEYPGNQAVIQKAEKLNAKSETPFTFTKGDPGEAAMSLTFLAFLLVLIGTMITAPNFAAEYQGGADDIFRSTKYGRGKICGCQAVCISGSAYRNVCCLFADFYFTDRQHSWMEQLSNVCAVYLSNKQSYFT